MIFSILCKFLAEFAEYEFGKVLGAGAFGQVIAATQKEDNLPVGGVYRFVAVF